MTAMELRQLIKYACMATNDWSPEFKRREAQATCNRHGVRLTGHLVRECCQ
jgi:hypothetical protein